jgi:hypothetical protein
MVKETKASGSQRSLDFVSGPLCEAINLVRKNLPSQYPDEIRRHGHAILYIASLLVRGAE